MHRAAMLMLSFAAAFSCGSGEGIVACRDIPSGGCPLDGGGTCSDKECEALFGCVSGQWSYVETCDNGSPTSSSGGSSTTGGGGQGGCTGAEIDKTGQVSNCGIDLQVPDCPVEVAESCHPCTTGCIDFFLCTSDGWQAVAYCNMDYELVIDP